MAVTPGLKAAAGIKKGDSMTVQRKLWADWKGLDEEEKAKKTTEAKEMAGGGNEKGANVMRSKGGGNEPVFTKTQASNKEIDSLKPKKIMVPYSFMGQKGDDMRVDVYADLVGVRHFKGVAGANYDIGVVSTKGDFSVLNVGRSESGNRQRLGVFRTQRQANNAAKDLLKAKIDFNNVQKKDAEKVKEIFSKHGGY